MSASAGKISAGFGALPSSPILLTPTIDPSVNPARSSFHAGLSRVHAVDSDTASSSHDHSAS